MWLLDQWAERHILDAQTKGEFDNLPGAPAPGEDTLHSSEGDSLPAARPVHANRHRELAARPGSGEPLTLDDDSHVPAELRAGYRLLKNAGCLPPEPLSKSARATASLRCSSSGGRHPAFFRRR
jgi:hypothetical protein